MQVLGILKKFPICNSWVVRHENKDKANLFLKTKLLDFFPAGAGAVNVSEKLQSPLRCTGKSRYFREMTQYSIQENYLLLILLEFKRCKRQSTLLLHSTCNLDTALRLP